VIWSKLVVVGQTLTPLRGRPLLSLLPRNHLVLFPLLFFNRRFSEACFLQQTLKLTRESDMSASLTWTGGAPLCLCCRRTFPKQCLPLRRLAMLRTYHEVLALHSIRGPLTSFLMFSAFDRLVAPACIPTIDLFQRGTHPQQCDLASLSGIQLSERCHLV
jgi:hypothetical protein